MKILFLIINITASLYTQNLLLLGILAVQMIFTGKEFIESIEGDKK